MIPIRPAFPVGSTTWSPIRRSRWRSTASSSGGSSTVPVPATTTWPKCGARRGRTGAGSAWGVGWVEHVCVGGERRRRGTGRGPRRPRAVRCVAGRPPRRSRGSGWRRGRGVGAGRAPGLPAGQRGGGIRDERAPHARDGRGGSLLPRGVRMGERAVRRAGDKLFRLPGYVGGEPSQPVPRDVVAVMAQADGPARWSVDFWVEDAEPRPDRAPELGGSVVVATVRRVPMRQAVLADPRARCSR